MAQTSKKSSGFNSRLGVVLAAAGSAIGLGNIWKFPYVMGANGGGAFLLIYLLCVLLFGLPLMLTEFLIGKQSGQSAYSAFRTISGNNRWQWLSWWCIISTFLYLVFYFVITGLCANYLYEALTNNFVGQDAVMLSAHFTDVLSNSSRMFGFAVIPIVLTTIILFFGVEKGLERLSKVLMPVLLMLMLVIMVRVLVLDGSAEGLRYMFGFKFSEVTPQAMLMAVGQCFFSLSVGCGMMVIFGAYMPTTQDATTTSMLVITLDTLVALLAGFIIFPAVFSFGFNPQEGPQLVFAILPVVFQHMSLSWLTGSLFFMLLLIAALSSTIAIMEVIVANILELSRHKMKRHWAVLIASGLSLALVGVCVQSVEIFNGFDMLITTILMPVGALSMSLFAGWFMPMREKDFVPTSQKRWKRFLRPAFVFALRWIVPVAILLILLNGFGVFDRLLSGRA